VNTEERKVATVAKELLVASPRIDQLGQVVLGDDEEKLDRPHTVVAAKFVEEEAGAPAAKYTVTVTIRALRRTHPAEAIDEAMQAIGHAICPAGENSLTLTAAPGLANFSWFRFDSWSDGDLAIDGDKVERSRAYTVFAKLVS
jgi:hypothetical protein